MTKRFFKLSDNVAEPHRWHLAMPTDEQGHKVDDEAFRRGIPVQVNGRWRIPVELAGNPLDFSEAGIKIPVLHVRIASILSELAPADVQWIPVDIEGHPDQYLILNALHLIRCIDEQASRIQLWTHEDGVPHKVGQYLSVRDMKIDKSRVGEAKVLRPEGWASALIVSEEIKAALERMQATGTKFAEV